MSDFQENDNILLQTKIMAIFSKFELMISFLFLKQKLFEFLNVEIKNKMDNKIEYKNLLSSSKSIYKTLKQYEITENIYSMRDYYELNNEQRQFVCRIKINNNDEYKKHKNIQPPPHLKEIIFGYSFNEQLMDLDKNSKKGIFSSRLTRIKFGEMSLYGRLCHI